MLAPLSVVGVAGVCDHPARAAPTRGARGTAPTTPARARSARRSRTRPRDVELGRRGGRWSRRATPTCARCSAVSVAASQTSVGPSSRRPRRRTPRAPPRRRLLYGRVRVLLVQNGKDGNPGFANAAGACANGQTAVCWRMRNARAVLDSAERFSSSRVSARARPCKGRAAGPAAEDDDAPAPPPRDAPAARAGGGGSIPGERRRAASRRRPCWTSPAGFGGGRRVLGGGDANRGGGDKARRFATGSRTSRPRVRGGSSALLLRARCPLGYPGIVPASPPGRAVRLPRLRPSPRRRGGASSKRPRRERTRAFQRRRRAPPPSPRAAALARRGGRAEARQAPAAQWRPSRRGRDGRAPPGPLKVL